MAFAMQCVGSAPLRQPLYCQSHFFVLSLALAMERVVAAPAFGYIVAAELASVVAMERVVSAAIRQPLYCQSHYFCKSHNL